MNAGRRLERRPIERPIWRIVLFSLAIACVFVVLTAKLARVELVHGAAYRAQAQANQIRVIRVAAPRGLIYDRRGKVLVRNRPSFVVALIPSEIHHIHAEMATLARMIGAPQARLYHRLLHHRGINYTNFAQVADDEPYGPVILARNLTVAQVARLSERLHDLSGVDLEVQPVREYPYGKLGSHLFGYVGAITEREYERLKGQGYSPNDVIGKDGLEAEYDRYLRGKPGGQRIVVDAAGQVVPGDRLPPKRAVPGDSLILNIDWRLQVIAEHALAAGIAGQERAVGRKLAGAVVIEDPWNGAILALASYPNFNPNKFANGISTKTFERYLTDPTRPLFDQAIAAATPTGSVFKLIPGTGAITDGLIGPNEIIYDSGEWNCHGAIFRDIVAAGLGNTTFVPALAASSDGYFYQVAYRLGNKRMRRWALRFGLAQRTGIDLPGEYPGNWPTNAWMIKNLGEPLYPSDVCSLGIGQGAMQATPVQMANVVSVVVNGGTLFRPRIVSEIRSPGGHIIKRFPPHVIRRVPGSQTAFATVRAGMAQVTSPIGTAYGMGIPGFPYGGKTGTVQTEGGNGPNTTWFVCFAPLKHPQLAMAVYVEKSEGYGANVAAPIARRILIRYFRLKP